MFRPVLKGLRAAALSAANAPDCIARHYGGTDKLKHGYVPYYRHHFGPLRFRVMRVYEIGVGGHASISPGGSLPLWRDYFPRSTIVGLDIHEKDVQFGPRVQFARADQNSRVELAEIVAKHGAPNIVIDDGSHVGDHIRTSFDVLWPALRPGGWYVVEDLASSYFNDFGGGNPPPDMTGIGLVKDLVYAVETRDPTFTIYPDWGNPPNLPRSDVAAVHCYPGIAFFHKASD